MHRASKSAITLNEADPFVWKCGAYSFAATLDDNCLVVVAGEEYPRLLEHKECFVSFHALHGCKQRGERDSESSEARE